MADSDSDKMSDHPDLMDEEDCRPPPQTPSPVLEDVPDYIARRRAAQAG